MNFVFRGGPDLDVRTRNGRDCRLLFPKEGMLALDDGTIVRCRMPAWADSDGASIPDIARLIGIAAQVASDLTQKLLDAIGLGHVVSLPHDLLMESYGDYWPGAYWHDTVYRRKLEIWDGQKWVKATLSREQTDKIFRAIMFALGTNDAKSTVIYEALAICGQKAWDEDGKAADDTNRETGPGTAEAVPTPGA